MLFADLQESSRPGHIDTTERKQRQCRQGGKTHAVRFDPCRREGSEMFAQYGFGSGDSQDSRARIRPLHNLFSNRQVFDPKRNREPRVQTGQPDSPVVRW